MPYTIKRIAPVSRYFFACTCRGLVDSVRLAADPVKDEWYPYYGDVVARAVWNAKNAMRQARSLGLYPETATLEAECRNAA